MVKLASVVLLFLTCFAAPGGLQAQTAQIDSLEKVLALHPSLDTAKVNLLNAIAFRVYKDDADKTRLYATQAGDLSGKLGYREGKAESTWLMGLSYVASNKPLSAEYFHQALELSSQADYKVGMVKAMNSLGLYHRTTGDHAKAQDYFQNGIKIAETLEDKIELAKCLLNQSSLYMMTNQYEKAREGYLMAVGIFHEKEDLRSESICLNNLGAISIYLGNNPMALDYYQKYLDIKELQKDSLGISGALSDMGSVYLDLGDFPKALELYQKGIKIAEAIKHKPRMAAAYANIGTTYQRMNDPQALEWFDKALEISKEVDIKFITASLYIYIGDYHLPKGDLEKALDSYQLAMEISVENGLDRPACAAMNNVGTIYLRQKNYPVALSYTLRGLEIANKIKDLNAQKDIHYQLSEIYAGTRAYKEAYLNYKRYKELNDSLYGEESVKKITALEYTYKHEKEKQEIELLQQKKDAIQAADKKQQRSIIVSLLVGIILLTFITIYVFRSSRLKHQTNILLIKQKDEIEEKNEELLQLNEEISAQKDEITLFNAEIESKNKMLLELNATKDKFFGIIAHDLRNPFNAILGLSDLLVTQGKQYSQEQTMEYVGIMHASAQNAYKLLENLLEWSRSQIGGIEFNPKSLAYKDLIFENEHICARLAAEKDISIHNDIPANLMVHADQNLLNTILRNLMTNAIKFTQKGGKVTTTVDVEAGYVITTVRDTGIGMDEETRRKLFKVDGKVSIPGTENERGTGLGLILCKEFVEMHGGQIWVESQLGQGSEFKFSIPLSHPC